MRLIECDRCTTTLEPWESSGVPDGWATVLGWRIDKLLCPACVERALEKPVRDPVLAATDLPDVPMELGPPGTADALMHGTDIPKP